MCTYEFSSNVFYVEISSIEWPIIYIYHNQCIKAHNTNLNSPISVGHNNTLETTSILIMRINVGHVNFHPLQIFNSKLVWATLIGLVEI